MKKIMLFFIFACTSFTLVGMKTSRTTKQPPSQSMELTAPLIQQVRQEQNCIGLTLSCAGIGMSLTCALCHLFGCCCNCSHCCCPSS